MNKMKSQKGQALILIAFGVVALIGFTALAVDGGRAFSDRRHAQNAADTAVLAAALDKINNPAATSYKTVGATRATSNGYTTGVNGRTVEVNLCNESGVTCTGLPTGAVTSEYIRVKITSIVPLTFGRVLGRTSVTNVVEAIARVQGSTSTGDAWGQAGMVGVSNENKNCFKFNGNADLHMHGSGVIINCKSADAMYISGGGNISFDDDVTINGCVDDQHDVAVFNNSGDGFKCSTPQTVLTEASFASVPTTDPLPANCNTMAEATAYTSGGKKIFPPGKYTNNQTSNTEAVFSNGVYCFMSGFSINNSNATGTGNVQMIFGGDLNFGNNGVGLFEGLEFYTANSKVSFKGSITATDHLRFFATGTGGLDTNNATLMKSDNAYFFTRLGNLDFNSSTVLQLKAPTSGDYKGLLFYYPWENTNQFKLNGGTNSYIKGTILMPHSEVVLNGGSGMEVHGQIVAYSYIIDGGNKADVYYEPLYNNAAPANPTIELTK